MNLAIPWALGVALLATGCESEPDDFALHPSRADDAPPPPPDPASDGNAPQPDSGAADAPAPPPPFECSPASASSPVLAGQLLLDPANPREGDTLTVLVKSTNGHTQSNAPPMSLDATTATGTATYSTTVKTGVLDQKGVVYYYEVPNVPRGDVCLLTRIGGQPEVSGKVTVAARPAPSPGSNGVYRVATNHQWRCDEQPGWGNYLQVDVLDADGRGVPNAVVDVRLPDTTDTSNIKNAGSNPVPTSLTTDDQGHYDGQNWWPSNTNGFLVLELSVHGAASDVATEITTGWWETNASGCNYCNMGSINVWGHWSHTVQFRLDPQAKQMCVVPSDHAGQTACGAPVHIYHDPSYRACWPAQ